MNDNLRDLQADQSGVLTALVKDKFFKPLSSDSNQFFVSAVDIENDLVLSDCDSVPLPLTIKTQAAMNMDIECLAKDAYATELLFFNIPINEYTVLETKSGSPDLPEAHIDPEEGFNELCDEISTLRPSLRCVVNVVLESILDKFMSYPLAQDGAFARRSGALEATLKLIDLIKFSTQPEDSDEDWKLDHYFGDESTDRVEEECDQDLMVAAAVLHYVGSVMAFNERFEPTKEATLFHLGFLSYAVMANGLNKAIHCGKIERDEINWDEVASLAHLLMARDYLDISVLQEDSWLICGDDFIQRMDAKDEDVA
jgi:hypothetical protein